MREGIGTDSFATAKAAGPGKVRQQRGLKKNTECTVRLLLFDPVRAWNLAVLHLKKFQSLKVRREPPCEREGLTSSNLLSQTKNIENCHHQPFCDIFFFGYIFSLVYYFFY